MNRLLGENVEYCHRADLRQRQNHHPLPLVL